MTTPQTLTQFLDGEDAGLASVIGAIGSACVEISRLVALGAILDNLGAAGQVNVQDEEQKKLDVITNDILSDALAACPAVAGLASEELETIEATTAGGAYLALFDPLDGSSNIDVNVSIGTIFSILPAPGEARAVIAGDFLLPGRDQVAAGYAVYGPQTILVVTLARGVTAFTLDADGVWQLTQTDIAIPADTKEFAINMSNQRHWADPIRHYIGGCLSGAEGPRGKNFNMRWIASMVADVHRILMRGGIFLYPWDKREPDRAGKLRLMYEANPMALLVERAGGQATDGMTRILDIQPTQLHQRVPVVLGSANEVEEVRRVSAAA